MTPKDSQLLLRLDALYTSAGESNDTYVGNLYSEHCSYHKLYEESEIARKIVDLVPQHALTNQDIPEELLNFISLLCRHSRIDKKVFVVRNEASEVFMVRSEDCSHSEDDDFITYQSKKYYDFHVIKDGIIRRAACRIKEYESACKAMSTSLEENNIFVLKIKSLSQLVKKNDARGKTGTYRNRLRSIVEGRSKSKGVAVDSDFEDLDFVQLSLAGFRDVFESVESALVAVSCLPKSFLLGVVTASALSSSGSTDVNLFEASVIKYRRQIIEPLMRWLGVAYERNDQPLFEVDSKEKAEIKLLDANRVIALVTAGLVSQQTAQKILGLPVEVIDIQPKETTPVPQDNTYSSDLTRQE